jgi:hypothetical protein
MIPMTTNVNKSGGYLEVIVSEVMSFGWQVWSGPGPWWLRLVSFRKKIRYSDSSRYYPVSCPENRLPPVYITVY